MEFIAVLVLVMLVSLLGSFHCGIMCGGISMSCNKKNLPFYHFGRLWTYLALGVAVGISFSFLKENFQIHQAFGFVTGLTFIFLGFLKATDSISTRSKIFQYLHQLASMLNSKIISIEKPSIRSFLLGTVSGFLPCGWLYGFVLAASSFADPVKSPLVLLSFWIGTVPIFSFVNRMRTIISKWIPFQRSSGILLISLGLFLLLARILGFGHELIPKVSFDHSLISKPNAVVIQDGRLPFCGRE